MPTSIREKINRNQFSESEILDIANAILQMIETGQCTGISPDSVMLGDDNDISIHQVPGSGDEAFVAPECSGFISEMNGFDKADSSAAAAFYSLGMLIYYMYKGQDWFEANNESLLGIPDYKENRDSLINDMNLCGGVLSELTAWDPEVRFSVGRINLHRIITTADASVRLHYMCGTTEVKCEEIMLNDTGIDEFGTGIEVYDEIGNAYRILKSINIPYRPGVHDIEIEVEKTNRAVDHMQTIDKDTAPALDDNSKSAYSRRMKLIVITEGMSVGYSEYDAGYVFEGELSFKQLVKLKGNVKYRMYRREFDELGNVLDNEQIAIYEVPTNESVDEGYLLIKVTAEGEGFAIVSYYHNGEPAQIGDIFKFKV